MIDGELIGAECYRVAQELARTEPLASKILTEAIIVVAVQEYVGLPGRVIVALSDEGTGCCFADEELAQITIEQAGEKMKSWARVIASDRIIKANEEMRNWMRSLKSECSA